MTSKAVALFIFNRPECASRVFDRIRAEKPHRLFVVADGPRNSEESALCSAARAVTEDVTWDCEVSRLYANVNLGCGRCMSNGLDWVFSKTEEAIILEDDCVPDATFFPFCNELLSRYRNEPKVTMISGTSFVPGAVPIGQHYQFSKYALIWGWATWARSWRLYDFRMMSWSELRMSGWPEMFFRSSGEAKYWRAKLDAVSSGNIDTWDYQWMHACWVNGGLGVIPATNLVSNVGYDDRATHTTSPSKLANVPCQAVGFPLLHPKTIEADELIDSRIFKAIFVPRRTPMSVVRGVRRRCKGLWSITTTRVQWRSLE